jgi:hypothetical protein
MFLVVASSQNLNNVVCGTSSGVGVGWEGVVVVCGLGFVGWGLGYGVRGGISCITHTIHFLTGEGSND